MCPAFPQTFYIRRHLVVRDCSITVWLQLRRAMPFPSLKLKPSAQSGLASTCLYIRYEPPLSVGFILTPRRYRYVANTVLPYCGGRKNTILSHDLVYSNAPNGARVGYGGQRGLTIVRYQYSYTMDVSIPIIHLMSRKVPVKQWPDKVL